MLSGMCKKPTRPLEMVSLSVRLYLSKSQPGVNTICTVCSHSWESTAHGFREMMIHSSLPSTWLHWRAHTPSTFTSRNAFLIHEGAAIVTLITAGKKWNKCWAKNMSVFLLHENEGSWKTVTSSWNKEDTMAGQTLYDPLPTMFVFTHSASSTFTACFM